MALLAMTRMTITGGWYGVYLLSRSAGRPFELKDDLRLGDGPNLLLGLSFSQIREVLSSGDTSLPLLDLDWSEAEGGGSVRNRLADGTEIVTLFGRYLDSDGKAPRGLFVGGAVPDIAAALGQNQSGMAFRNARGWHHIWCNVNEGLVEYGSDHVVSPGEWIFKGSRVIVEANDRVVLESQHELQLSAGRLRVERFAYFKAGLPFFRLGINFINVGDAPVRFAYAYGDEPWVGEFGSSEGNLGWVDGRIVSLTSFLDPGASQWAGIVDLKSDVANFISWVGAMAPDRVYFSNRPGTPKPLDLGVPLASNEVFIGLEWLDRLLAPGSALSLQLTVGMAPVGPDHAPSLPAGVIVTR
jgi:hypothetical protein